MIEIIEEPKNTTAKVLRALILGNNVSLLTLRGSSLRARISDIRNDYGINIESIPTKSINEFGRAYRFATYKLISPVSEAKKVYEKINRML